MTRKPKLFRWINPIKQQEVIPLTLGVLMIVFAIVIIASGQTGTGNFLLMVAAVTLLRRRRGNNDES